MTYKTLITENVENHSSNLLKNTGYKRWFIADTATEIATGINSLVIPLLALHFMQSSASAGFLVSVSSIGSLIGLLPGGYIADTYNRRKVNLIFSTIAITGYLSIILAIREQISSGALLAFLFAIISFSTAVLAPVFTSSLKQLVPSAKFAQAMGANEARSALLALAVPPVAGLLAGISGVFPCVVALVCLVSSIAVFPSLPLRTTEKLQNKDGVLVGFSLIWKNPALRTLMFAGMLINAAVSTVMLVLIFSLKQENVTVFNIGLVQTAIAVGALSGAILSGFVVPRIKSGVLIIGSLCWISVFLCVVALSTNILFITIFAAISVVPGPMLNATLMGYTLSITPAHQQGRLDAAMSLIASLAAPVAPLISGIGTEVLPGKLAILFAVAFIVVAVLLCLLSPEIRTLQKGRDWAQEEG